MVSSSLQRWGFCLALGLLATAVSGQAVVETPITSKMRQQDRRLNTPVSFHSDRIYLGEALETLSAQTGVALSIDESDSFSGIPLTFDLKSMPLAKVMDSLCSLVASKKGLWEWQQDTTRPLPHYTLHPSSSAHALPVQLNQAMQQAFEAQAAQAIRLETMTPPLRAANVGDFSAWVLMDEPQTPDPSSGCPADTDQFWIAIRLFSHLLSPAQRTRVLRGEKIDVPIKSLSEPNRRDVLELERRNFVRNVDGPKEPPPSTATTITFQGTHTNGGRKSIALVLMVSISGKSEGSGRSYLGMVMRGQGKEFLENWILPGDQRTLSLEKRTFPTLAALPADSIWQKAPLLDRHIAQFAATANVSFIAVLPEPTEGEVPPPTEKELPDLLGKTPTQFFDTANSYMPRLLHKWRDGVLLVTYPTWFYGDDAQFAYGPLKRLRALVKAHRPLTLDDVVEPVTTMNAAQLRRLSLEFPSFENGLGMAPLVYFYQQFPEAVSVQGIVADLRTQDFFQTHQIPWRSDLAPEQMQALRIVDEPRIWTGKPGHTYRLQVMTSGQEWQDLDVFFIYRSPSS